MRNLFIGFWTAMVFASIAWYALLLFYVGLKGAIDIVRMARALAGHRVQDDTAAPGPPEDSQPAADTMKG